MNPDWTFKQTFTQFLWLLVLIVGALTVWLPISILIFISFVAEAIYTVIDEMMGYLQWRFLFVERYLESAEWVLNKVRG
jgi:hypothetical protein